MLKTDKLFYIELEKTACSHISYLIDITVGGKKVGEKHAHLIDYPTDKKIVGSVRNPWDWYVSNWSFGCAGNGGFNQRLMNWSAKSFIKNFKYPLAYLMKPIKVWREVYADCFNPELFRQWLKMVHDPKRAKDLEEGYYGSGISGFAGFFTYRYCVMNVRDLYKQKILKSIKNINELMDYENKSSLLDYVIKTESVEEDVENMLRFVGYELTKKQIQTIFDPPKKKIRASQHLPSADYYDDETIDIVRKREELIIKKYGYQPPK